MCVYIYIHIYVFMYIYIYICISGADFPGGSPRAGVARDAAPSHDRRRRACTYMCIYIYIYVDVIII